MTPTNLCHSTYLTQNGGNDCNGHGTHCSGTAAGSTYGIAKKAQLYSGRVLTCWGSGAWDDLIKGQQISRSTIINRPFLVLWKLL